MKSKIERIIKSHRNKKTIEYVKNGIKLDEKLREKFKDEINVQVLDTTEANKSLKILIISYINKSIPSILIKKVAA